jgi:hypothetical protein
MRYKDIKEAPQKYADQTTTQQITDPGEKEPGMFAKAKAAFKKGREVGKLGAGNKAGGDLGSIIRSVGKTAGEIKGAMAGNKPKPGTKFQKKDDGELTGQGTQKRGVLSSDPIMSPRELKDGSAFTDEKGITWTYNAMSKGWVSNSKTYPKPLNAKQGIEIFNKAQTRTKVESVIKEGAEARIQHAEDLVFFQGSAGAKRALQQLKELAGGGQGKVTIKWDGSPAVIFGRDEDGKFMLTDKGGFGAKGYDGKNKSPEAVEKMFLARPGAQKNPEGFKALAANMKKAYSVMEKATPENFRGYFKGDMLYFNTPNKEQDVYMFKPQIVQYMVKADSKIGKRIGQSSVGVVIHKVVDEDGTESPLKQFDMFQGNDLFVIPPVTVSEAPKVDESSVKKLEALVTKNANSIDSFLDRNKLAQMKVSDFADILYSYTNSKVDTGLDNLGRDFLKWLGNSKVSRNKQEKIIQYVKENINTFSAMWDVVNGIMKVKDNIIGQLDSQDSDVVASINGQPGGEGYVLSDPTGDMKLVNRRGFTAANRAQMR